MSYPRVLTILAVAVFAGIGTYAYLRQGAATQPIPSSEEAVEMPLVVEPVSNPTEVIAVATEASLAAAMALPDADRMDEFFNTGLPKFPIVETVIYSSRVPWKQGSSAWVEDYARHYKTSKHFIGRSLNGDYFQQSVANGDRFNVFKEDVPVSFHLVVDLSRSKMWVYYLDEERGERVLVKTYPVGVGRPDGRKLSGYLTPRGTYTLGEKIAVYRPGTFGGYNGEKCEMIRVFGTRWIPFDEEIGECTAPAKGLGLHGCPWREMEGGQLAEDSTGLGGYDSDGCVRLATDDIEELFAVIITKPSTVYLVDDFFQAELPGKEIQ